MRPHGLRFDPAPFRDMITKRKEALPEGHAAIVSFEIMSAHPIDLSSYR